MKAFMPPMPAVPGQAGAPGPGPRMTGGMGLLNVMSGGMAGAIMANVGAQLKAAKQRAQQQALVDFHSGPKVESDGTLQLNFIEMMWSFSPAYPEYLSGIISQDEYWKVIMPLNDIMGRARDSCGAGDLGGDVLEETGDRLQRGDMAGIRGGMGDMIARGQAHSAAKVAGFEGIKAHLFQINRAHSEAGIPCTWKLQVYRWQTTSYTPPPAGQPGPGRSTTNNHERWYVELAIADGAARLPPDVMMRQTAMREAAQKAVMDQLASGEASWGGGEGGGGGGAAPGGGGADAGGPSAGAGAGGGGYGGGAGAGAGAGVPPAAAAPAAAPAPAVTSMYGGPAATSMYGAPGGAAGTFNPAYGVAPAARPAPGAGVVAAGALRAPGAPRPAASAGGTGKVTI